MSDDFSSILSNTAPSVSSTTVQNTLKDLLSSVPDNVTSNAVLEALCDKGEWKKAREIAESMIQSKVKISVSAAEALLDSAVKTDSMDVIVETLTLLIRGNAINKFGAIQPGNTYHTTTSAETAKKTASFMVSADANRASELFMGAGFVGLVGGGSVMEVVEPFFDHGSHAVATAMLVTVGGGMLLDRFVTKSGTFQTVSGGLRRLAFNDPARECTIEAAHILSSYLLGLPFVCYQPNAKLVLQFHQDQVNKALSGSSNSLTAILMDPLQYFERSFIWMVSGTVAELCLDERLIDSDSKCVQRLIRKMDKNMKHACGIFTKEDERDRIRWAYDEAIRILENNKQLHTKLTSTLLEGASVGECVKLIESSSVSR
eukprot:CAMPEP_0184701252 /NCGR_PEP_ID=MMETSP0313-20130426/18875_1 /TAXON_ID=2792 /ORGANISM="Porphyridium aerugineum, Strain SAG 1380-2" /LENGTH=372 /DNA_ID=CAMNT_0027161243 /DNA_START=134 /DNA_END=1252 /DNA_ORIENTATION=-